MFTAEGIVSTCRKFKGFFLQSIFVAVSFIDPGNFSSNTTSGATYQYKLLFVVFASNLFAILLQCLCIKLGSVTGLDLAENCRKHLPRWLNSILYVFAETAIVATDLAEVIGTAIALEILFKIPLKIGVLVTILDVIAILFFYRPDGSMVQVRLFEIFVSILVALTILCFTLELFKLDIPDKRELLDGFFPSKELLEDKAIYLGCAIVGATVMPHSLYLGSALVQPRLREYDSVHGLLKDEDSEEHPQSAVSDLDKKHKPSLQSIKFSLNHSYWELIISLFIVATFVNSSILIVAGSALYGTPDAEDADLVTIYELLNQYISKGAGLIFALSMLFSGQASGLVVTLAGQVVSEGFIKWSLTPWKRRVVTRMLAIIPCLFMTFTMGRQGVNSILNGSQVVLSFILPFSSAPLLYFTCNKAIMKVVGSRNVTSDQNYGAVQQEEESPKNEVDYSNSTLITILSLFAWATVSILNILNIIFMLQEA